MSKHCNFTTFNYSNCIRSTVAQADLPKCGKTSSRRREDPKCANKTVAGDDHFNDALRFFGTFQEGFADFTPDHCFTRHIWEISGHIRCRRHFAGRMSLMLKSLSP